MSISKRADLMAEVGKQIRGIWRDNEGPWQNIFRILTYILPWVPGLGWGAFFLDKIASYVFGFGIEDLGAWTDNELGLGPGSDVGQQQIQEFAGLVQKKISGATASSDGQFEKIAFLGGLLKMTGGISRVISFLTKLIKIILLAVGAGKISDLYNESFLKPIIEPNLPKADKEVENMSKIEKDDKDPFDEAQRFQSFIQDPQKLVGLFT